MQVPIIIRSTLLYLLLTVVYLQTIKYSFLFKFNILLRTLYLINCRYRLFFRQYSWYLLCCFFFLTRRSFSFKVKKKKTQQPFLYTTIINLNNITRFPKNLFNQYHNIVCTTISRYINFCSKRFITDTNEIKYLQDWAS